MNDEPLEGEVVDDASPHVPAVVEPPPAGLTAQAELTPEQARDMVDKVIKVQQLVMRPDIDYGTIAGIKKPTLFKSGAEKLCVTFRLATRFVAEKHWHDGGHLTVESTCELYHVNSGLFMGSAQGICSTYEAKYRYRKGGRTCPECGAIGTIRRSKYPPRGAPRGTPPGWWCSDRDGGCKADFEADDQRIVEQEDVQRIENPDLADTWNTVIKMADKRALVAACLIVTGASAVFTQDVEDTGRDPDGQPDDAEPVRQAPQPAPLPATLAERLAEADRVPAMPEGTSKATLQSVLAQAYGREPGDFGSPKAIKDICGDGGYEQVWRALGEVIVGVRGLAAEHGDFIPADAVRGVWRAAFADVRPAAGGTAAAAAAAGGTAAVEQQQQLGDEPQ